MAARPNGFIARDESPESHTHDSMPALVSNSREDVLETMCPFSSDSSDTSATSEDEYHRRCVEEVEELYTAFVTKKGMLPLCSWPLFSIDDDISSEGTVSGLDFFGLKL